ASQAGLIAVAAGVAVVAAIGSVCNLETDLLWPNDILHHQKKLGGILIEAAIRGDEIEHAVVGLGLNVNAVLSDFPAGLCERVTTLREILGHEVSRQAVLAEFFRAFENRLQVLAEGSAGTLLEEWREHAAFIGDEVLVVLSDGKEIQGVAQEILNDGRLKLKARTGDLVLDTGDFVYLKAI
ncbi:MAG: biotin--[acetyl-CoA-carboxylase] ligase, partial [bacterium]